MGAHCNLPRKNHLLWFYMHVWGHTTRPKLVISNEIKQAVKPEKEGTLYCRRYTCTLCNEKSTVITTACP